MKNIKHLGLRIDEDLLNKFHFACDYEGRSANSQILVLIRKFINEYESKYGKIELKQDNK